MIDSLVTLLTYSGEIVSSFRSVLKRYVVHRTESSQSYWYILRQPTYPRFPGQDPNGKEVLFGNPYTISQMTPLNWVLSAFTGYRGAIRVGVLSPNWNQSRTGVWHGIFREAPHFRSGDQFLINTFPAPTTALQTKIANKIATSNSWAGTTMSPTSNQPSVLAEIPYYSNKKFLFCKRLDQAGTGDQNQFLTYNYSSATSNTNVESHAVQFSYAVGEDFQVGLYQGPPVMFVLEDPPF
jgi:hypothetical protein